MGAYGVEMLNLDTGVDEARYFSLVLAVAIEVSPRLRRRALMRLVRAVREEDARRSACRDVDVAAATRARAWLDGLPER